MGIRRSQSVRSETTRKTSNGAEKTFESFHHVMRDRVFIYLNRTINAIPIKEKFKALQGGTDTEKRAPGSIFLFHQISMD